MSDALVLTQLPVPSTAGSIDAYIAATNRIPLLTEHEERELARKFRSENDITAARQLVLSHLRLVVSTARGYLGYGLPHADLIQEGNIGLMKAVKRYDPERGVRLVSFAIHWIKAEIHEYILRNWRLVKIATTKAQRKLFFNLRSMKQSLATLSHEEVKSVATKLGVKPEEVVEMETRISGGDVALDPIVEDDDNAFVPAAYLAADTSTEPIARIERQEADRLQTEGLQTALSALDDRSRDIVRRRWLVEDDEQVATLHELADQYGVSAERIRQIEAKALQKMKVTLVAT